MLTEIVQRLEGKVEMLLQLQRRQQVENRRLRGERDQLLQEREQLRGELDRIIVRLARLDAEL